MAVFPKTESEIRSLAQKLITGLTENPHFPSPPVSPSELRNSLDAFTAAIDAQTMHYAVAEQSTDTRHAAQKVLVDQMRADFSYGEFVSGGDDSILSEIGWSMRAPHVPLVAPGQPRNLQVVSQGLNRVHLRWERPNEGGAFAYFVIKRLALGEEAEWLPIHTLIDIEVELNNQERGKEMEYCVVAVNKSGESLPSNSVMVVL